MYLIVYLFIRHNECNICGKVYKWAQSLQYHLRTHIKKQVRIF